MTQGKRVKLKYIMFSANFVVSTLAQGLRSRCTFSDQPVKVTSTCSQRFAQLDPHCPIMLKAACERSRAGAVACRLSLTWLSRLPAMLSHERGVQTDLMRRRQCAPCDLDVRNMHTSSTAGRPEPALTTQVPPQLVSCGNHGNLRQLPSSS